MNILIARGSRLESILTTFRGAVGPITITSAADRTMTPWKASNCRSKRQSQKSLARVKPQLARALGVTGWTSARYAVRAAGSLVVRSILMTIVLPPRSALKLSRIR